MDSSPWRRTTRRCIGGTSKSQGGSGGNGQGTIAGGAFVNSSAGKGNRGGHGGGAGGGGPSYGILVDVNMAPEINRNTFLGGIGGAPGADGDGTNGGADGGRWGNVGSSSGTGATGYQISSGPDASPAEGGWSYNIHDVNPFDGLVPNSNGNTFNPGTAGSRGQAGEQNF